MATDSSKRPGRPFVPGVSGNPGGLPKKQSDLTRLCREHGVEVFHELMDIVRSKPQLAPRDDGKDGFTVVGPSHSDRINAGKLILAYGFGAPRQTVAVESKDIPDADLVRRLLEALGDTPETRQILDAQFRALPPGEGEGR